MSDEEKLAESIEKASHILVVQADNPDGDSLGSAIALEQILTGLGKEVTMYCAVNIPVHLHYLTGWSRVTGDLPNNFDLSIIVDTSSAGLLEKINGLNQIKTKPCVILDHHQTEGTIDFASLVINRPVVATGELIYDLAKALNWQLNQEASEMLAISILSDSLGLMSKATTSNSIRIIADLVDGGCQPNTYRYSTARGL
ncbi:MAG: DHH family phosphoesterase [Candidatus Saccharibacteria bacterium]